MTDEQKYIIISNNDASYDGKFYYAVKTTGIYCRPSCKSKVPKKENILFFDTVDAIDKNTFRPCKRCRPDVLEYQPNKEMVAKVKHLVDENFKEKRILDVKIRELGLTQQHVVKVFKECYGMTLLEYISDLRLTEAKYLLVTTDDKIVNIAYAVGFESVSTFYRFFKRGTGVTPRIYRTHKNK